LDYAAFESGVTFTLYARNVGVDSDNFTAAATFTIRLAPTPSNAYLEANVNSYPFTPDPLYGGNGRLGTYRPATRTYEITGYYDEVGNHIMHIDGPFPLFDSLWIDGVKKTVVTHYLAEDGSTRITILAQTIKELDNGEHTAAAAFRRAPESGGLTYAEWNAGGGEPQLDVVAENFIVNLSERPKDDGDGAGGKGDGGGDKGGGKGDSKGDGGGDKGGGKGDSKGDGTGGTGGGGKNDAEEGVPGTGGESEGNGAPGNGSNETPSGGESTPAGGTGGAGGGGAGTSGAGGGANAASSGEAPLSSAPPDAPDAPEASEEPEGPGAPETTSPGTTAPQQAPQEDEDQDDLPVPLIVAAVAVAAVGSVGIGAYRSLMRRRKGRVVG
jgi:hypothetical protein